MISERRRVYENYLLSAHWRQLRSEKFNEIGRKCQHCESENLIHVHHIRYRNLTDCITSDLLVLCEDCHFDFHKACKKQRVQFIDKELSNVRRIIDSYRVRPHRLSRSQIKAERRAEKDAARRLRRNERKKTAPHRSKAGEIFNRAIRNCRHAGYTIESVNALIQTANDFIALVKSSQ